ncbi:MFS transporter [Sphingomonas canadensis]|uniref:MFS transporter n=1 Tax=Sphingomonas canadensis TaxID=1219257 RepID=A0ABW3H7B0_9SPHN|nr:MFS transporter [Sphingomonas canadensis]MCW3836977.1 MFS transporter [Sphingomonas canadensis]
MHASDSGPGGPNDLTRLIDDAPWSGYQKLVLVWLALVFAVDGLANQSLGITLPAMIADWKVRPDVFAPVTAANLTGVALGSVIGGLLGDRVGRRWALIGSILLFGAATACGALAQQPIELMIIRLIDGLGIGAAIPNGAALISEFTPARRRGRAIAIGMVFIPIGGILAGGLGATILEMLGWRTVLVTAGVVPIVLGLSFIALLPESPAFLLRAGKRQELDRLLARCGIAGTASREFVIPPLEKATAPMRVLLVPEVRRATLLLWGGFFTCLMASYTIFSWVPTMLHMLDFDLTMTSLGLTTFHTGGVIGALFSGLALDRKGFSTTHMALSGVAAILALTLALLLAGDVRAAAVIFPTMLALGFCMSGLHNTLYTLAANTYPTAARATGVGMAAAVGRLGAVLSSFTGVRSLEMGGSFGFFAIVALLLALCGLSGWAARGARPGSGEPSPKRAQA